MMLFGPPPKKPPDEPPRFAAVLADLVYTAPMANANDRQVGGDHYKTGGLQHWDLVNMFGWDYFQGQIIKYLMRWRKKNGLEDLEKARHYLDKYIEVERSKQQATAIANSSPGPQGQPQGER